MKNDLVSIIVPVYNVEKYLIKCVDSIINQTYKNIEILLIDDGSTDSSGKICDEISKKDKRIKVFHKKNGGLSDARNYGILKSKGEYLSFIDSDDYIDDDMIEKMYYGCVDNNCDMIITNKILELESGKKFFQSNIKENIIVNTEEALKLMLLSDPSVCDKMFKKELFKNISFPIGKLYEDILTTPYLIMESKKVYLDKNCYYHYINHSNSIVHNNFSIKKMDYVYNAKKICNVINQKYPSLIEPTESYYILVLTTILSDMYCLKKSFKKQYKYVLSELKMYKKIYIKNKYIPKSKKIMIFLDLHRLNILVNFIKRVRVKLRKGN